MRPWGHFYKIPLFSCSVEQDFKRLTRVPLLTLITGWQSMPLCILQPNSNSNRSPKYKTHSWRVSCLEPVLDYGQLSPDTNNLAVYVFFRQSWRFMQKSTQRLHWRDERTRRAQSTSTRETTSGIATELGTSFERAKGALCSKAPTESWTQAESWTCTDISWA